MAVNAASGNPEQVYPSGPSGATAPTTAGPDPGTGDGDASPRHTPEQPDTTTHTTTTTQPTTQRQPTPNPGTPTAITRPTSAPAPHC